MLKVALGQFAVSRVWEENAQVCEDLMRRAREAGAGLLILPEGILARDGRSRPTAADPVLRARHGRVPRCAEYRPPVRRLKESTTLLRPRT